MLLERADQIAALRAVTRAAAEGSGRLVLVRGEAGTGKSALLRESLRDEAALTLAAAASELDVTQPYGLVIKLLERHFRSAGTRRRRRLLAGAAMPCRRLFDGDAAAASHGTGLLRALYRLVVNMADELDGGLLLVCDDLHWCDPRSLEFVAWLGGQLDELPVSVIGALRPAADADGLGRLLAAPGVTIIELPPLSAGAVDAVVERARPGAPVELARECFRVTGGLPFLVHAFLETEGGAPDLVMHATLRRLRGLGAEATALAQAVAVLDHGAPLALAAALAQLGPERAADEADRLAAECLLLPGEPLRFRQPLVRSAVHESIGAARRAALHAHAGRLLAEAGASAAEVGAHLLLAPRQARAEHVTMLRSAAAAATGDGAAAAAVRFLRRALEEPPAVEHRATVLAELGVAEVTAGEDGTERLRLAAELATSPAERARIQAEHGRMLFVAGRAGEAAEAFLAASAAAPEGSGDGLAAELDAGWLTLARFVPGLRPRAVAYLEPLLDDPPEPAGYGARALLALLAVEVVFQCGPHERAIDLARAAFAGGALINEESSDGPAWISAASALGWADDYDGFERICDRAIADARRRGSITGLAIGTAMRGSCACMRGRPRDLVNAVRPVLDADQGSWSQFLPAAHALLAAALFELDDLEGAEALVAAARREPGFAAAPSAGLLLEVEAQVRLHKGEAEAALRIALHAGDLLRAARMDTPAFAAWRTRAAGALARLGRREEAGEYARQELALAQRFGAPRALGIALMGLASTMPVRQGVEILEEAVDRLAASPAVLEQVRARVALGSMLRRSGYRLAARDVLREGLDAARRLELTRLECVAVRELEMAGGRASVRPWRGAEALTPSESRIAELAAQGQTNREIAQSLFVSLRTVETHLTHAYMKLGGITRRDLAATLGVDRATNGSRGPTTMT